MKKRFFLIPVCCLALFSCKKETTTPVQATTTPTAAAITSPSSASTLAVSRQDTLTRVLFKWNPQTVAWDTAKYGKAPAISFALQLDSAGGNFAKIITLTTTTSDTFSMTYGALNKLLFKNFGIPKADSTTTSSLELRIVSTITGTTPTTLTSIVVAFKVTTWINTVVKDVYPTFAYIYLAGNFPAGNSWATPAVPLVSITQDNRYEGWVYFDKAGEIFKAYGVLNNWGAPSWGDSTINGQMSNITTVANYSGDNWAIPAAGLYQVGIKLDSMKNYLNPVTWSILGDATPGGWTTDTQLTPDATNLIWSVTCNLVVGSFKFRANDAWNIDYTQDPKNANGLLHANNLWLEPYNSVLGNISVTTAGKFTITMDLSVPGKPIYSIK